MNKETVIIETTPLNGGYSLGTLTLNQQQTLNSLTLSMVDQLREQLDIWKDDPSVAAIFLQGAGDKAFCAGGDIQQLYHSMINHPSDSDGYAETFFEREYQLDYMIHAYPKPIMCWGNGIIMGGGSGLFAGASHRIANERTRFAMPEVGIGLFPDVGGSYFLNQMPDQLGAFFALSTASLNAIDCQKMGLADYLVAATGKAQLLQGLVELTWSDEDTNHQLLSDYLRNWSDQISSIELFPASNIDNYYQSMVNACQHTELTEVLAAIASIEGDDSWIKKARKALQTASPLSTRLAFNQLQRCKGKGLVEVFQSELSLVINIARYREFAEGVRALIVDKDMQPKWSYDCVEAIPQSIIDHFFNDPWSENPLKNLANL